MDTKNQIEKLLKDLPFRESHTILMSLLEKIPPLVIDSVESKKTNDEKKSITIIKAFLNGYGLSSIYYKTQSPEEKIKATEEIIKLIKFAIDEDYEFSVNSSHLMTSYLLKNTGKAQECL